MYALGYTVALHQVNINVEVSMRGRTCGCTVGHPGTDAGLDGLHGAHQVAQRIQQQRLMGRDGAGSRPAARLAPHGKRLPVQPWRSAVRTCQAHAQSSLQQRTYF